MPKVRNIAAFSPVDWFVDRMLKRWGKWAVSTLEFGLGYPSRSVEGRLLDGGGLLVKSTAKPQIIYDDESEKIEKLLNELGAYKPQLALSLKLKYTSQDLHKDLGTYSLPMPTFKKNLAEARVWMAASLQLECQAFLRKNSANEIRV